MGISGISPMSLLLILAILVMLFGTKRLRHLGKDVGMMLKSFQSSMQDEKTTTKSSAKRTKKK
jgi:sec-independent protein translocase protein TatA